MYFQLVSCKCFKCLMIHSPYQVEVAIRQLLVASTTARVQASEWGFRCPWQVSLPFDGVGWHCLVMGERNNLETVNHSSKAIYSQTQNPGLSFLKKISYVLYYVPYFRFSFHISLGSGFRIYCSSIQPSEQGMIELPS